MKTFLFITASFLSFLSLWSVVVAQENFEIIPWSENEGVVTSIVTSVWSEGWNVWETYKQQAEDSEADLWNQLASWVMTRDTLLNYVTYLVKFLWQVALLVWAIMIIYAGYKKATEMFKFPDNRVTNVIKWIIVIAFAYAFIRILVSMFIS